MRVSAAAAALGRVALAWLILAVAPALHGTAAAQPPAEADSTYPAPPPTSASTPAVRSQLTRTGEERDRFELGAAVPRGDFDWLGTLAYRRFIREGGPFEQSMQLEVGFTTKEHLTEGSLSLFYFFRPMATYKEGWKLRPLVEIGPGGHVVVQSADIEGFDDSAFHSQGYLKMHAYLGFELLLGQKLGFLARGRASIPEHHPLDYAQAAIFLR